jgi:hypothetical protein
MPGTREVETPFFLEPFTGTIKEITDPNFLGIETVFTNRNFYVNLQPCPATVGCGVSRKLSNLRISIVVITQSCHYIVDLQDLNYDFEDVTAWNKLLIEPKKKEKKVVEEGATGSAFGDEEEEEAPVPEMYLDMPISWVPEMHISAEGWYL